jgi:thiosulfate reductase cytochrome b subunit
VRDTALLTTPRAAVIYSSVMATAERLAVAGRAGEARHATTVRITHWVNVLTFVALTVSGIGILLAHPRLYWGESGYFDTPAAFELPLPVNMHHTWWGRGVHFLSAWVAVLNGLAYVAWGFYARHFQTTFVPDRTQLEGRNIAGVLARHLRLQNPADERGYNLPQKLAYSTVVFGLLPLAILSGLTMSPGFTSAFPQLFALFGGRQSARTVHFFLASALVIFVAIHIAMVFLAGFRKSVLPMITGGASRGLGEKK